MKPTNQPRNPQSKQKNPHKPKPKHQPNKKKSNKNKTYNKDNRLPPCPTKLQTLYHLFLVHSQALLLVRCLTNLLLVASV